MYVHIGNDEILNREDIIAVLDLNKVCESRQNLRIINAKKNVIIRRINPL